jgi:uncharacterized protein YkwD
VEFALRGIFVRELERTMRVATFVAIFVALVAAEPAAGRPVVQAAGCAGETAATASAATELASMHCLVNRLRTQNGLPPLRELPKLDRSSTLRAAAIRRCGQFSHTPCGQRFVEPFVRVGYLKPDVSVGENLAWGGSSLGSPSATLAAWLRSPEHRANLFQPAWRDFGVALARGRLFGNDAVSLWVLQFGRRS